MKSETVAFNYLFRLPSLTLESALELANERDKVRSLLVDPHTCSLTTYPDYGATLSFDLDHRELSKLAEEDRERILLECKRNKDELWAAGKFKKRKRN